MFTSMQPTIQMAITLLRLERNPAETAVIHIPTWLVMQKENSVTGEESITTSQNSAGSDKVIGGRKAEKKTDSKTSPATGSKPNRTNQVRTRYGRYSRHLRTTTSRWHRWWDQGAPNSRLKNGTKSSPYMASRSNANWIRVPTCQYFRVHSSGTYRRRRKLRSL